MSASKVRGKKWTVEEDEALCIAWLNVSQDGATGTNQKLDTLYDRIYEMFVEICTTNSSVCNPELRAPSGLKARWLVINKACSKFAGCMSQIFGRQQSGATPTDVLKQALTLYSVTTKGPFTLLHAYKMLEKAPKWQQYQDTKPATANSSKRRRSDDGENFEEDNNLSTTQSSSSTSRPIGQKASKHQQKLKGNSELAGMQIAKAGNLLAEASKEKAVLARERTQAINRMVNHSIMSVDFSTLSETAKKYYEMEQERILQQAMAKNVVPETLHNSYDITDESEVDEVENDGNVDTAEYVTEYVDVELNPDRNGDSDQVSDSDTDGGN